MVNVGDQAKLVNAQKMRLLQGSNDYHQVINFRFGISYPSRKRARTDGVLKRKEGLGEHYIEGDIALTEAEVTTFVGFATPVSGELPENNWDLKVTARDTSTDTIRIGAKMSQLIFMRPYKGLALFHFKLDTVDTDVTEV